MKKISLLVVVAALAGCPKKRSQEAPMPSGSAVAMGSAGEMGSAMPAGSAGSAGSAAKPMTGEELAKRFEECWALWSAGKLDEFKSCYTADALYEMLGSGMPPVTGNAAIVEMIKPFRTAFPDMKGDNQLELISGHTIIAVTLVTGTNTGPMKTPAGEAPPTNKKVGMFTSQVIDADDRGQATHEREIMDMATMMGQLNPAPDHPTRPAIDKLPMPKEVVIAKDDAKEKANLEADQKLFAAFNKHDAKMLGEVTADNLVWSEQPEAKDLDKQASLKSAESLWKGFSDAKLNVTQQWAAGDYVATLGTLDGTNDGELPMIKKKTGKKVSLPFLQIDKLEGGKVKNTWLFYQSMGFMQQLGLMPQPGAPSPAGAGSADKAGSGAKK